MTEELWKILVLSLATAAASFTISKGAIFAPLRNKLEGRWLGKLISCWYCTSHYVAALAVIVYPPDPFSWGDPGRIVTWLAIVACSALIIVRFE